MSRSDFWSIAATLIVAGAGYFVSAKVTAYTCIGLGVATILVLLLTPKKSETASASQTANPQMIANPQMTANPQINQHFHLPGSEKPEQRTLPPVKPKPQHNLKFHSCRMAKIRETLGNRAEMEGFHLPDDQSNPNAAVVFIKNKSKEGEVAHINDVRAALTFRDSSGKEIGQGIYQACWADSHLRNASFDLEETKCVILVIFQGGPTIQDLQTVSPYIKEEPSRYGAMLTVEALYLDESLSTVELILLSKRERVMEPMTFELTVEDGKPGIKLVTDEEDG